MRRYRRNADEDLRALERRAASGDPQAAEALLSARLRTGFFDEAADSLISQSGGRLPSPLIHRLHEELMKHDLMEKLKVWVVELESDIDFDRIGIYGTRMRALAGAAAEGANYAARRQLLDLAERMEAWLERGYEHLNTHETDLAELAFGSAVDMFNAEWHAEAPGARLLVRQDYIE